MKIFLKENWFKILSGISMLVFSVGFLMYSVTPLKATEYRPLNIKHKAGDLYMTGCGIDDNYAYFVSFEVNEQNEDFYFKVPLSKFKLLSKY